MSISISALPSTKKMNFDAKASNIIGKAEKRLCIIKQLAKLQVKQSTINPVYKMTQNSSIESIQYTNCLLSTDIFC